MHCLTLSKAAPKSSWTMLDSIPASKGFKGDEIWLAVHQCNPELWQTEQPAGKKKLLQKLESFWETLESNCNDLKFQYKRIFK